MIIEFLNSLDLPALGTDLNKKLICPITKKEIEKVISKLKTNKSPGTDGFPPEWYKSMTRHLLPLLEPCFNHVLKEGQIPPSWKEAFISVIPKEGKDKLECKSYRPISVLNIDYKIFTNIIASRLETAMAFLIDEDQTGFIKNRQAQDNIRRTLHIIEHINRKRASAVILSLDAEKAFDSVGWEFLYLVLHRFSFSRDFIRCIETIYSCPTARIKINGHLSNSITLHRGCRQGCPLSPSLFNLFIEPLAQAIRQEKGVRGDYFGGRRIQN